MLKVEDFEVIKNGDGFKLKWNEMTINLTPSQFKNKYIGAAVDRVSALIKQAEDMRRHEIAAKLLCEQMTSLIQEPDDLEPVC